MSHQKKLCKNEKCIHGNELQPLSNFYKNRNHRDGLMDTCKDCDKEAGRIRDRKKRYAETGFMNLLIGGGK